MGFMPGTANFHDFPPDSEVTPSCYLATLSEITGKRR